MRRWSWLPALVLLSLAGCRGHSDKSKDRIYDIKGTIVAVDASKPSVKLDHQDIPGLMPAMVMDFDVENAKILEGLKIGDKVQGKLKVDSGRYILTHLEKTSESVNTGIEGRAGDVRRAEASRQHRVAPALIGSSWPVSWGKRS